MSRPRVAVVGVGSMGNLHAEKLAELATLAELVGVHDLDPARAREVAQRLGVALLDDLEAVTRAAQAAFIAVPTIEHARVAVPLLRAGLDVFVEKPVAASASCRWGTSSASAALRARCYRSLPGPASSRHIASVPFPPAPPM